MTKGNQNKQFASTQQNAIQLPKDSVAPSHSNHLTVNNLNAVRSMHEDEVATVMPDLGNQREVMNHSSCDEASENDVVPNLQN